mgnify:CR=1 FL=1
METEVLEYLIKENTINNHRCLNTVSMIYPGLKNKSGGKPALVKSLNNLVKKKLIIKCVLNSGTVTFKALSPQ